MTSLLLSIFFDAPMGLDQTAIQDRNGIIFLMCMIAGFTSYNNALIVFLSEKALFKREILNNSYSVFAYFLSRNLVECTEYLLAPIVLCTTMYYLMGFQQDLNKYLEVL